MRSREAKLPLLGIRAEYDFTHLFITPFVGKALTFTFTPVNRLLRWLVSLRNVISFIAPYQTGGIFVFSHKTSIGV